jgi:hypothetical protein
MSMHQEEAVTFNEAEWAFMMSDPCYFGYSCPAGHALREDDPIVIHDGCQTCASINDQLESWEGCPDREVERWLRSLRDFPLITCGKCKGQHVGTGAVRRCYGLPAAHPNA